jgi:hypothetical protein
MYTAFSDRCLISNLAEALKYQDYDLYNNVDEVYLKEIFEMSYENIYEQLIEKFSGFKQY